MSAGRLHIKRLSFRPSVCLSCCLFVCRNTAVFERRADSINIFVRFQFAVLLQRVAAAEIVPVMWAAHHFNACYIDYWLHNTWDRRIVQIVSTYGLFLSVSELTSTMLSARAKRTVFLTKSARNLTHFNVNALYHLKLD